MKKFLLTLMVAVSALSVMVTDAQAKRLGGGGSFGKQSQSFSRQSLPPSQNQATPAARPAPAQQSPANAGAAAAKQSPWKGILGGALLGLGLGALLSHLGIGGALASMIGTVLTFALLALAAMFIYRLLTGRKPGQPQPAFAGAARMGMPETGSRLEPQQPSASSFSTSSFQQPVNTPWGVPADFDADAFLRHAKTYFIRLQAAWDKGNVDDLHEFTTPEMFAELRLQLQERGQSANFTDVVSLDAELLGMETIGDEYLASVRFSGMIREAENATAEPFVEIWNLAKPVSGKGGWLLAGIQQTA